MTQIKMKNNYKIIKIINMMDKLIIQQIIVN